MAATEGRPAFSFSAWCGLLRTIASLFCLDTVSDANMHVLCRERSAVLTDVQIKAVSESVWRRPTVDTADQARLSSASVLLSFSFLTERVFGFAQLQVTSPHTARAGEYKEILGSLAVQDAAQSSHKFYKWLAECEADIR